MEFTNLQSAFIYIFSILFLALYSHLYTKNKKNIFLFIGIIPLLLLATFRNGVGTDYKNYYSIFMDYKNKTIFDLLRGKNIEIGYFILNKIGHMFNSFNVTKLSSAIIILIVPIWTIKDEEKISLPIFIMFITHFYINSFNITRQSIAVAIVFNAMYSLIKNKRLVRFLILTLVASTFHMTALVVIPFIILFLPKSDKTKNVLIYFFIFIISLSALYPQLFFSVISKIPYMNKYISYGNSKEGNNLSFYLNLAIFIFLFLLRKHFISINQDTRYFLFMVLISVILTYLGFEFIFVKRIASYFSIFQIVLISMLPNIFIAKDKKIVITTLSVYSVTIFLISYWVYGFSNIFPYII